MTDTSKPYKILFVRLDSGASSGKAVQQDIEFANVIYAAQDLFRVEDTQGLTLTQIVEKINDVRPNIIHMSGHGSTDELQFTNLETIVKGKLQTTLPIDMSEKNLEKILGAYQEEVQPRILFINACFTRKITSKIAKSLQDRFDCTIGMRNLLNQKLALDISKEFYTSMAEGDTVEAALARLYAIIEAEKKEAKKDEEGYNPQPKAYGDNKVKFDPKLIVHANSIKGIPYENKYNVHITVSFEATGEWLAIPEEISDPGVPDHAKGYISPNGVPNFKSNSTVYEIAPFGALVVIGEDKQCKAHSAKGSFDLKPGETVHFMMNDVIGKNSPTHQMYQDNKGSIEVKLSIEPI